MKHCECSVYHCIEFKGFAVSFPLGCRPCDLVIVPLFERGRDSVLYLHQLARDAIRTRRYQISFTALFRSRI